MRNRIITGMPLGVVIVEVTARLAMEFGREVFGVPGNITEETSLVRTS